MTVGYLLLALGIEYAQSQPKVAAKFAPASLRAVAEEPYEVDADVAAEAGRILGSVGKVRLRLSCGVPGAF